MATTITYKGSDLTSFSNTSKTLRTAGKYLEGDITITAGLDVNNQNKTVIPSEASQSITADTGYTGLGTVTVNGITNTYVGSGINRQTPNNLVVSYNSSSDRLNINVPKGYYESTDSAVKRVDLILPTQSATIITPSESQQTAVDIHKWTTGTVTVAAITPTYVGSEVPQRTNADLSFFGGSFTGPSGYYASNLNKNISVGSLQTPTISSSGLVTASAVLGSTGAWLAQTESPKTLQLPTQAATTVTPSSVTQTITGQKYMTGNITVEPIPSQYIVPSGTLTITSVDTTTTFDATSYASVAVNLKNADVTAY